MGELGWGLVSFVLDTTTTAPIPAFPWGSANGVDSVDLPSRVPTTAQRKDYLNSLEVLVNSMDGYKCPPHQGK